MNPMDFLDHVQPEGGWYAIVGIRSGKVRQTLVETREEAEDTIDGYLQQKRDVYFGVAKYAEEGNRTKENVQSLKAFWLDIDCSPTKAVVDETTGRPGGYIDQAAGLTALKTFCKDVGLPKPTLVNSGRGLHVYWTLEEPITRAQWEPVAAKLRDVCRNRDFYVDDAVFEVARILRVPGTLNFKDDPPTDVSVLHVGKPTPMAFFRELFSVSDAPPPVQWDKSETSEARKSGLGYSFKKIMQRTAKGDGCAQLEHAYVSQASADYYTWFYAVSVAAMCDDASTAVHMMSENYPDYDPVEVDKKAATIRKSTSCARFKGYNPTPCEGCPHFGKIMGPRDLGAVVRMAPGETIFAAPAPGVPKQTYTIPKFPAPYYRGESGGVWRAPPKDEPEAEPICVYEHDIYVVKRMTDIVDGVKAAVVLIRHHLPMDGVGEFSVPMHKVTDSRELKKALSMQDVVSTGKSMDMLMDYIMRSVKELQHQKRSEIMRQQFGWADNGARFIIGDQEIDADGVYYSPPSKTTQKLAKFIGPKGSLEKWKQVWALYGQPGMEGHAFAALSAFGSPLLRFLNQTGAVINLYNPRSGTGKTTVLNMVNSVYGHPKELRLQQNDTMNGRLQWVGILNNLPATMDELTNATPQQFSDFLYSLSNGKGKERMMASTNELRENNTTWQNITVSTSNASFAEKVSIIKNNPEGELMRLFEYPVDLVDAVTSAHSKHLFDDVLFNNFGHAGPIFMRYVLSNYESVQRTCQRAQAKVDLEVGLLPKERFWSAGVAANFVGGVIAKRLGLIDWDMDRIYDWACDQVRHMRSEISPPLTDVDQILGDYLYRHMQNILTIPNANDRRTGASPLPKREPKGELLIRIEPDTRMVYLISKPFKEYCVKYQINYREVLRILQDRKQLVSRTSKRMGTGTNIAAMPVHALGILLPEEATYLDNYTVDEEANEG